MTSKIEREKRNEYIRENYMTSSLEELAGKFNVSKQCICQVAVSSGIKKYDKCKHNSGHYGSQIKNKMSAAKTAIICGDVVRHLKKYGSLEELFEREQTAKTFNMTVEEVIYIFKQCVKNGRFKEIKDYIKNTEDFPSQYSTRGEQR
ncbi:MAG: hypothetical protein IJA16_01430 [Clostridia bacterium]|nr:hypothetical protein [Clostridia bacterium]